MKIPAGFFENKTKVFLFLFIPTVVLYAKSLVFGFTPLDEKWLITDNVEYLKLWRALTDSFTTSIYKLYYRPLLAISIFIDFRISGLSTPFYHITNLIWHLVCVFGLFRFLTLFSVPRQTAAFFALLFSLHPMMVHAVAWVPGRNDVMLCAFTLGSLIFLKKYQDTPSIKFAGLHLLLFACALFTKENAISLPAVFLVMLYAENQWKKTSWLIITWTIMAFLWLMLRNVFVPEIVPSTHHLGDRVVNFLVGFFTYFGKSILPLRQSVYPTRDTMTVVIGVVLFVLFLVSFFKPGVNNKKTAFTGLTLFFVLLILPLVYSSGTSNPCFYEHRTYTSICGLFLFVSQLRFNFNTKAAVQVMACILVLFFARSFYRMAYYHNEKIFLAQAIKEQPGYFLFQAQYAESLFQKGEYGSSIVYYDKAIALRPDKADFYNERGRVHFVLGNYAQAISDISSAIQKSDFNKDYYFNRCMAYNAANDIENAMKDLYVLVMCCRGEIPKELEKEVGLKWRTMFKDLSDRIGKEPNNADLLYKRSKLYFDTGQKEQGFADIQKAISLDPQNPVYKNFLKEVRK